MLFAGMSWIGLASVHRTNGGALLLVVVSNAFHACVRVDQIGRISLADRLRRAGILAGTASNTIAGN
jgi:hypothetical protein